MSIGFCYGVGYDPYYGSAGFRAVADNFSWPSIAAQNGSYFSMGGFPSLGSGFSFYPGGVFGGSCWGVPGGYYCSWNGPFGIENYLGMPGFPSQYLPYLPMPYQSVGNEAAGGGNGGGGDVAPAKPKKRAAEPAAEEEPAAESAPKKVDGEGEKKVEGDGNTGKKGNAKKPVATTMQSAAQLKKDGYDDADVKYLQEHKDLGKVPKKTEFARWYAEKKGYKLETLIGVKSDGGVSGICASIDTAVAVKVAEAKSADAKLDAELEKKKYSKEDIVFLRSKFSISDLQSISAKKDFATWYANKKDIPPLYTEQATKGCGEEVSVKAMWTQVNIVAGNIATQASEAGA